MEYTSEEKAYIWLDSFALERNEKRRLLSQAGGAAALVREGLSPALGDYLEPYAFAINETIESPEIRNQHIMQD